jgi:hypothetical protein
MAKINLDRKNEFIHDEFWTLTIGGAFQRANVYPKNVSESDKTDFKAGLRKHIEEELQRHYRTEVTEEEHLENIHSLNERGQELQRNWTRTKADEAKEAGFNFGIAQKMLNLHLKYRWCDGEITVAPPHFPVDRIIQVELNKRADKKDRIELKPWTKFTDKSDYLKVIELAYALLKEPKYSHIGSIADLELLLFSRRGQKPENK